MTGEPDLAMWRDLAESLPDPVAIRDEDGRLVWVNRAYCSLVGRDPADLIGRLPEDLWPAEVADDLHARVRAAIGSDVPVTSMESWDTDEGAMDVLITNTAFPGATGPLVVSIVRDLSRLRQLGTAFHDRERVFHSLFDRVGDGVFVVDLETMRFTQFNAAAHEALGYTREEFEDLAVPDIQGESSPEWVQARMAEIMANGSARFPNTHRHKDGSLRHVIVDNSLVEVSGRPMLVTVVHDVTELTRTARMLDEAQELAALGGWELDIREDELRWSEETHRIFGTDPHSFTPSFDAFLEFVHPDDRAELTDAYWISVRDHTEYSVVHRAVLRDGSAKVIHERGRTEYDAAGEPIRSVGTCQDVTREHESRRQLNDLAFQDSLTALPNRAAVGAELEQRLSSGRHTALLQVDLADFQQINGTFGHAFGDEVLREVGRALQTVVAPGDIVARVGGDEFLIVTEAADEETAMAVANRVRGHLRAGLPAPGGREMRLDAYIGVALDGSDAPTLLRQADTALHLARGAEGCQIYRPEMAEEIASRLEILSRIDIAIDNGELVLEYQPQVDAARRLAGAEALVRWRQPDGSLLPPGGFLPLVESAPVMERLGNWVLETAAAQIAEWSAAGLAPPTVAVNVSARQFQGQRPVSDVLDDVHARYGLPPGAIELEITETVMMPRSGGVEEDVAELARRGVPIAVDDFGTGYTSMTALHLVPLAKIKMDKSLVRGLPTDERVGALAKATLAVARALHVECLAEGVETEAELAWLEGAGCALFQGFLFDRPLPPDVFAQRWLGPVDDSGA